MNKPMDRRVRYTIQALQKALIALLQTKTINRISIRELCDTADINRSTFYMHYKDIYDLLDAIEQTVYDDIEAIFAKETPSSEDMLQLLHYVQSNKDLFRVLYQQGNGMSMSRFVSILHMHYSRKLKRNGMISDSTESMYLYEFLYTGILGVLQKWLQNDCKDDPHVLTEVIWHMIIVAAH